MDLLKSQPLGITVGRFLGKKSWMVRLGRLERSINQFQKALYNFKNLLKIFSFFQVSEPLWESCATSFGGWVWEGFPNCPVRLTDLSSDSPLGEQSLARSILTSKKEHFDKAYHQPNKMQVGENLKDIWGTYSIALFFPLLCHALSSAFCICFPW